VRWVLEDAVGVSDIGWDCLVLRLNVWRSCGEQADGFSSCVVSLR
jgi:hypothetical protein